MARNAIETDVKPIGGVNARGRGLDTSTGRLPPIIDNSAEIAASFRAGTGSLAASIASIGEDLHKSQVAADTTEVVKSETKFKTGLVPALDKLDKLDPDYLQKVQDITNEAAKETANNATIRSREGRAELDRRLAATSGDVQVNAISAQKKSQTEETLRVYDVARNGVNASIRANPSTWEAQNNQWQQGDGKNLLANMDGDIQRKVEFKNRNDALASAALGYADKGQFEAGKKLLSDNAGSMDPAQEQKVLGQMYAIHSKQEADSSKYAANVAANVMAKINDFAHNTDPTAEAPYSRAQLDNMRGMFTNNPGAWVSMVGQLNAANAHKEQGLVVMRNDMTAFSQGTVQNQEQADRITNYAMTGQLGKTKAVFDPTDENTISAMTQIAGKTGFIPSQVKAFVNNANAGTGPQDQSPESINRLAQAVTLYNRFQTAVPNLKWQGSADDKDASVATAAHLVQAENLTPIEAARRVITLTPRDKDTAMTRGIAFQTELKALRGTKSELEYGASQVKDNLTSWGRTLNPMASSVTVRPEVAQAYNDRFEASYKISGDKAVAKAVADDFVQKNFAITNIGADKAVAAPFAPEMFVPPSLSATITPDVASKMFNDEIMAKLSKDLKQPVKQEDFRVLADSQTTQEANAFKATGNGSVSYVIQMKDAVGNFQTINGPRWRVPTADEITKNPAYIEAQNAQIRSLDTGRAVERYGFDKRTETQKQMDKSTGNVVEDVNTLGGAVDKLGRKLQQGAGSFFEPRKK